MSSTRYFLLLTASLCAVSPVVARADATVDALRSELAALRADYESRIATLEARLTELDVTATMPIASSAGATDAITLPDAMPAAPVSPASSRASAFNPAIALILGGSYSNLSQDPADFHIAGFLPAGDEIGPGERSFNLGESEVTLSANVDPYFAGSLTVALSGENEVGVEEAFVRTLALPAGLSLKAGRFFSGFGYLNEVHAHAWDFADQPLVYQAFFGGQRAQDGAQLKWVAPTDVFVELGAETGNGDGFPGTRRSANGLNGTTLFAHVGSDIGDTVSWRGGVSWVDLDAEDRSYEDTDALGTPVLNAYTGDSSTWIVDATLKWTPLGNTRRSYLKLQAEYMRRTEDGVLAFDTIGSALADGYRSTQSGWYVQGVYRFLPRWRAGLRHDDLDSGAPTIGLVRSATLSREDFPLLLPASPSRTSLMLDWSPSEFSRLRAQFAWDDARDSVTDEQFFLQYIHALGAHGAHRF